MCKLTIKPFSAYVPSLEKRLFDPACPQHQPTIINKAYKAYQTACADARSAQEHVDKLRVDINSTSNRAGQLVVTSNPDPRITHSHRSVEDIYMDYFKLFKFRELDGFDNKACMTLLAELVTRYE